MLRLVKALARPWFRVLFSLEHRGAGYVPGRGAAILAGNHPSYLDPVLISLAVPRPIRFMAWDALFRVPLLGPLIRAFGAFPVDLRRGRGEAAYRAALEVLARGEALGIFPEGQRSEWGPMGELRAGAARLAVETGAPIIPVTIGGAARAWPKHRLLPKPAKIVVRYHPPIHLDPAERAARREDRDYHQEIMRRVAASIDRSLAPALREGAGLERWYRRPPAHVRSYEWAPLLAAAAATLVARGRGTLAPGWPGLWLPPVAYYLYLLADLALIRPGRLAKWLRNSMPIWLILAWHHALAHALAVPEGEGNELLVGAALAAFFPFFWEDYYTLQKFVRGLVVAYYCSLALLLRWPHPLGVMTAALLFIALFAVRYRVMYHPLIASLMLAVLGAAVWLTPAPRPALLPFALLAAATLAYLQTFVTVAYDIRKAGEVREGSAAG